jgi:galactose mutarotase-like enzyme
VAELRSPGGELEAVFMARAGMPGWSLCHRRREVVAHPVSLREYVETGEPTGIALLHPWANRLASPEYEIAARRVRLDLGAPSVHTDGNGLPIMVATSETPPEEMTIDVEDAEGNQTIVHVERRLALPAS